MPVTSRESGLYETQYEALRAQMLGATTSRGVGLAVLLQTGVAGWLRALGTCAPSPAATPAPRSVSPTQDPATILVMRPVGSAMMTPETYTEAARLIASLVLSGHPGPGPFRASRSGGSQ